MKLQEAKRIIAKNKKQHWLFAGKGGYVFMGMVAGWSLAHWFVHYAGGIWPHNVFIGDAILEVVNKLGGLTAVVSSAIAIYTVYMKKQRGQADG